MPLNGTYIRLVLEFDENLDIEDLKQHVNSRGFILSTLFPHECKLSVMHFKIQRHFDNKEAIPSKHEVFTVRPIFSLEPNSGQGDKLKYMRFLRTDVGAIASIF